MKYGVIHYIVILSFLGASLSSAASNREIGDRLQLPTELVIFDSVSEADLYEMLNSIAKPEKLEVLESAFGKGGLDFNSQSVLITLENLKFSQESLKTSSMKEISESLGVKRLNSYEYRPNYLIQVQQDKEQKDLYNLQLCLILNEKLSSKNCENISTIPSEDYATLLIYSKYKEEISSALYSILQSDLAEARKVSQKSYIRTLWSFGIFGAMMIVGGILVFGLSISAGWAVALMIVGFGGSYGTLKLDNGSFHYNERFDKRQKDLQSRELKLKKSISDLEKRLMETSPEIFQELNPYFDISPMP